MSASCAASYRHCLTENVAREGIALGYVGGSAIAQAAVLRIALRPVTVHLTEYADVAALVARAAVMRRP